jgi:predicted nuclease of predicted toxin-antitoxin system
MNDLCFLADIHISPLTVQPLKQAGYDTIRITDSLPNTATDREILEFARLIERIIITQDLDFSTLIALNNYGQPSLITLRLSSANPNLISQKLLEIIPQFPNELKEGIALTITNRSIRIRKLPIH